MAVEILGLDIGGANLKAAHTSGDARTVPFALWKHPERLGAELARLCATMPAHSRVAVTMTGELCDCFESKRDGVRHILSSLRTSTPPLPVRVWTTLGRFLDVKEALETPLHVAAANWLALAQYVGRLFPSEAVVLIDTGSTTTDIVFINRGKPEPHGLTDPDRLASGELVYTGLRRTPICAVLGMDVAAEFFATMLDAYLMLGLAREDPHDCDTADGRPATIPFAHARLARMRCADVETFSAEEGHDLAERAAEAQRRAISAAVKRVLADRPRVERVVLAGSGAIVGRRGAAHAGSLASLPVTPLAEFVGPACSEAACAYAVAQLAAVEAAEHG